MSNLSTNAKLSHLGSIKYIVITPVRDEVNFVEKTIESVCEQTIKPLRWIIVDDGSTDGTGAILDVYASKYDWITIVHRPDRGSRVAGGGVVEAFYSGFNVITESEWDFIVKLDGDLSFDPDYFEKCFEIFDNEKSLGIGGGTVCKMENGEKKVDSIGDPPFHVRGATKIYRRECWDKIKPLLQAPGWDTIDEVKANYHGWTTRTFKGLDLMQHKPTGGADGEWKNWLKNGRANYITGYHPLFMLIKCIKRLFRKPYMVTGIGLFVGYIGGYLKGIPMMPDREAINYLRQQQLKRIFFQHSIYSRQD